MNQELIQWMKPRLGPLLGLIALVLYTGTMAGFAVPGESARLIAGHTGLSPFPDLLHPLWGLLARGIARLPFGTVALRLNIFSSLCGALTVWLFYELASRLRFTPRYEEAAPHVHLVTGVAAAAFLSVSTPFWIVSNRAHTASFDLLLLVGALFLLQMYKERRDRRLLFAFSFLYGLGIAESATFLVFAPALGLYTLGLMGRAAELSRAVLKRAALWLLAGLTLYIVGAIHFRLTPAYEWRGFTSIFQVLWYTGLEQWTRIAHSLPRVGWLLVLLVSLLPWTLSLFAARYATRAGRVFSLFLFHAVLTITTLVVLFDGPIAPWSILGTTPLLVTPYLFIASTFGYAAGHWYILLARRLAALSLRPRLAEQAAFVAIALILLAAAAHNAPAANARAAAPFQCWAGEAVRTLPPRSWVVTDGLLDETLQLAARDSGLDVRCISTRAMGMAPYRKCVAAGVPSPRLSNLAQISLPAFLREWARTDPDAPARLAVMPGSDLWRDARLEAVPERVLYGGRPTLDGLDAERLFRSHEDFWERIVPPLRQLAERQDEFGPIASILCLNLSRIANDLGVTLETMNRPALAEKAYTWARTIEPNNLSALLNLHVLLEKAGRTGDSQRLWNQVENVLSHPDPKWPLFRVVQKYGRINSRTALERVRALWGAARPHDAAANTLRAAVRKYLAGDTGAARDLLQTARRETPDSQEAWIMSGMLAYETGDRATLAQCIDRMQSQHREWPPFLIILGDSALAQNDPAAARQYYERALARQPLNLKIHEALVKLDLAERDFELLAQHLNELLAIDPGNAWGNLALGTLELRNARYRAAEAALLKSVGRAPTPIALNNLAWTYCRLGRNRTALEYGLRSLELRPTSPEAWDTLGMILVQTKRYDRAEQSFRESLSLDPQGTDTWTHLRDLLLNQGRTRDAALMTNSVLSAPGGVVTNRMDFLNELRETEEQPGADSESPADK